MTTTIDGATAQGPPSPGARHPGDRIRTTIRSVGELFITVGVVLLLFVVYELYWTDVVSAGKQATATSALDQEWAAGDNPLIAAPVVPATPGGQRTTDVSVPLGDGFAKMYVPSFGSDFEFTVLEGTSEETLAIGPGHYEGTAFPGQPGNFSVAGHRVGKGAPFNDLDLLASCDAVVVETAVSWFVYRVLPMADEVAGWSGGRGASDPSCAAPDGEGTAVAPLGGDYAQVVGREIVDPSQGEVIAPVPGRPEVNPAGDQAAALLTLTTCHPRFSAQQRMIIHANLVHTWDKADLAAGALPPELGGR